MPPQPPKSSKSSRHPNASHFQGEVPKPTPHGSYKRYYRRRLKGGHPTADVRLPYLHTALMSRPSAKILDIGCNDGVLTSQIALMKTTMFITGIDLDQDLIKRARRINKKRIRDEVARLKRLRDSNPQFVPLSCRVVQGSRLSSTPASVGASNPPSSNQGDLTSKPPFHDNFPFNLSYRCEDIVAETPGFVASQVAEYDVILCLSVTKWIHLHSGDDGLKRLFDRMYALLKPGGILILEPQPARSYKRARQRGIDGVNRIFSRDLHLYPSDFPSYLTSAKVGFERFEMLKKVRGKGNRFDRSMFIFYKTDTRNKSQVVVGDIVEQILGEVCASTTAALGVAEVLESVFDTATSGNDRTANRGLKRKISEVLTAGKPKVHSGGCKHSRKNAAVGISAPYSNTGNVADAITGDIEGGDVATAGGKDKGTGREDEGDRASSPAAAELRGGLQEEQEVIEVIDLIESATSDDQEPN